MEIKNKATQINLFSLKTVQMCTFHTTWFAFFLAFFGWFGIAPLMAIVREDLMLTKAQIGNTIIASVAITVIVRILIGPLCDRIGSRKAYTWLLILGSLPVMGIGLAQNYETFLLFRLAIGAIGAAFVITQYHTSTMFAPNCVGTANATTAGWGNLGGGVTQMVMPLIFTAVLSFGVDKFLGWRLAMILPGIALFITGFAYYFLTQDAPDGNYKALRARGDLEPAKGKGMESFMLAIKDYRVWALFVIYAACFGVELTINNVAALYYHDQFQLDVKTARAHRGIVRSDEHFCANCRRVFLRFLCEKDGTSWTGYVPLRRLVRRRCHANVVFADGSSRACCRNDDCLQSLCADVRRRDLRDCPIHQSKGVRRRCGYCGCGWKRWRSRRGFPVPL